MELFSDGLNKSSSPAEARGLPPAAVRSLPKLYPAPTVEVWRGWPRSALPLYVAFSDTLALHSRHKAYRNHDHRNRDSPPASCRAEEESPPHGRYDRIPPPPLGWPHRLAHRGPSRFALRHCPSASREHRNRRILRGHPAFRLDEHDNSSLPATGFEQQTATDHPAKERPPMLPSESWSSRIFSALARISQSSLRAFPVEVSA